MMNLQSHGRPHIPLIKIALTFAVPAVVFFGVGASVGLFSRHTAVVNPKQNVRIEEVNSQLRILSQTFHMALDRVKTDAVQTVATQMLIPGSHVLQVTQLQMEGLTPTIRKAIGGPIGNEKLSPQAMATMAVKGLRMPEAGMTVNFIRPYMAVIFKSSEVGANTTVAIVDPRKVFSGIRSLDQRTQTGDIRAMIVSDDGYVVTHSQEVHDLADVAQEAVYALAVKPIFSSAETALITEYQAIDKLEVTAATSRVAGMPVALVIERTQGDESFLGFVTEDGTLQSILGRLMVTLGIMILAVVAFSEVFRRNYQKLIPPSQAEELPTATPTVTTSTGVTQIIDFRLDQAIKTLQSRESEEAREEMHVVETTLRRELQATQAALKNLRDENALMNHFESESLRVRDPGQVAQRAVHAAHKLCQSPTIFFSFQEQRKVCSLYAAAGMTASEIGQPFSVPVDEALVKRVLTNEIQGQLTSLTDYEPLHSRLLTHMGIAHFEAWAVTGFGHLGRQSQKPRLLGIMVVLNAGTESLAKRESLKRVLRSTGLIYENTLLSR